jgi:SAM-dependent methyltransferase
VIDTKNDAYGAELEAYIQSGRELEIVERDDGFIEASRLVPYYFSPYRDWSDLDREAAARVRGRTLDVGCGAGRVALHLQDRGHEVVAIDNSPGAVRVSRSRGVKNALPLSFTGVSRALGVFDTVALFGANMGLFGGRARARWLLRRLRGLTAPDGRIVGLTNDPYLTDVPEHLDYHKRNVARGRMGGQLRIRVRYRRIKGPWFDYLFLSPRELTSILEGTGWVVAERIESKGAAYAVVLAKG